MIEKYNQLTYYTLSLQDECFIHQYVVDAYTAQTASSAIKPISLVFSLVGLYLYIQENYSGKSVQKFHTFMSDNKIVWPNFTLPKYRGDITIDLVLEAITIEQKNEMIHQWCISVWNSYSELHSKVKEIVDYYFEIKKRKG